MDKITRDENQMATAYATHFHRINSVNLSLRKKSDEENIVMEHYYYIQVLADMMTCREVQSVQAINEVYWDFIDKFNKLGLTKLIQALERYSTLHYAVTKRVNDKVKRRAVFDAFTCTFLALSFYELLFTKLIL